MKKTGAILVILTMLSGCASSNDGIQYDPSGVTAGVFLGLFMAGMGATIVDG